MRRYLWDFPGMHGEGTAWHFHQHLGEFIEREKLEGCEIGVVQEGGRFTVFCDTPDTHHGIVQRALRPRRYVERTDGAAGPE